MGAIRTALLDTVLAALPIAFVYFAGWAYLSSYLDAFNVDATQVSVPLTTVLVYAFRPLSHWYVLGLASLFLAVWHCCNLLPRFRSHFSRVSITYGIVALVIMMFAVKSVASSLAIEMAEDVWRGGEVDIESDH